MIYEHISAKETCRMGVSRSCDGTGFVQVTFGWVFLYTLFSASIQVVVG